jgi:hypothetical protein
MGISGEEKSLESPESLGRKGVYWFLSTKVGDSGPKEEKKLRRD